MRRKCPNCGKMPDIPEGGGYCTHCGTYIEGKGSPTQVIPTPTIIGEECPWEEMEKLGFFRSLWETISGVLFNPSHFFSKMPRTGIGKPLLFAVLVGSVGGIISLLWQSSQSFLPHILSKYPAFEDIPIETFWPYWLSGPAFMVVMIFLTPVLIVIGLFITSAILHLCLMILGGAQSSYEATFRVVAYSNATNLWQIFPFCGGFISLFWSIVVTIIGLRETHRISGGKAAAAFFLPLIFCCAFIIIIFTIIGLAGYSNFSRDFFY